MPQESGTGAFGSALEKVDGERRGRQAIESGMARVEAFERFGSG